MKLLNSLLLLGGFTMALAACGTKDDDPQPTTSKNVTVTIVGTQVGAQKSVGGVLTGESIYGAFAHTMFTNAQGSTPSLKQFDENLYVAGGVNPPPVTITHEYPGFLKGERLDVEVSLNGDLTSIVPASIKVQIKADGNVVQEATVSVNSPKINGRFRATATYQF